MPINASIALSSRGLELPNPLTQYSNFLAVQNAQREGQLNALRMQEAQAASEERNALRRLDPSASDYENQLFRVNPQLGIQYRKEAATAAAQNAAQRKSEFDLRAAQEKSEFELKVARQKFGNDLKRGLSANPSDENIIAFGQDALMQGLYSPEQIKATVNQMLALPANERVRILSQSGATVSELKPTVSIAPTGIVQTPAFGGNATVVPGTSAAFQMTPAQAAANKIAQGQLDVSRGQLGVAQQRLNHDRNTAAGGQGAQNVSIQQDVQGNLVAIPTKLVPGAPLVATPITGGDGAPIKGKPSAFAEKATAQKAQLGKDINQAIFELTSAVKDGGLIDQSTGSGVGKLIDTGAGFFGRATPGAIAAGRLAPIADIVLKMVPRFEGPQSTQDVQSYKEAAGQLANMSMPTETRKAAANEILRLMKTRKNQFTTADMTAPSAPYGDLSNEELLRRLNGGK